MFREKSESQMQVSSSYSEPLETSLWVEVRSPLSVPMREASPWVEVRSPLSVPTVDFSANSLTAVCKKNISNALKHAKKEPFLYQQLEKMINEKECRISYNGIKTIFKEVISDNPKNSNLLLYHKAMTIKFPSNKQKTYRELIEISIKNNNLVHLLTLCTLNKEITSPVKINKNFFHVILENADICTLALLETSKTTDFSILQAMDTFISCTSYNLRKLLILKIIFKKIKITKKDIRDTIINRILDQLNNKEIKEKATNILSVARQAIRSSNNLDNDYKKIEAISKNYEDNVIKIIQAMSSLSSNQVTLKTSQSSTYPQFTTHPMMSTYSNKINMDPLPIC